MFDSIRKIASEAVKHAEKHEDKPETHAATNRAAGPASAPGAPGKPASHDHVDSHAFDKGSQDGHELNSRFAHFAFDDPAPKDNKADSKARQDSIVKGQIPADLQKVGAEDGVVRYKDQDGKEFSQYEYFKDGQKHTETTTPDGHKHDYAENARPDGAIERRHLETQPNGDKVEVLEVEKDNKIQRTTTDVSRSNRSFKDEVGGDIPKQCSPDSDAPLEVTNIRTTTIDNSQQPPQERVVSEGRRVAQSVPINDAYIGKDIPVDQSQAKFSYNQMTTYDDQGKPQKNSGFDQEMSLKGRNSDGVEASVQQKLTFDGEGKLQNQETHYRGVTRYDVEGPSTQKPFSGNAGGVSLVANPGGDSGVQHLGRSFDHQAEDFIGKEYMDLDISRKGDAESFEFSSTLPNGDRRKVSRVQGSGEAPVFWNYNQTSKDGNHITSQTVKEGDPNFLSTTQIDKESNGTAHIKQQTMGTFKDGHVGEISHNNTDHLRLEKPDDVDSYAKENSLSADQIQRLKQQIAEGKEVFSDSVDERFTSPDFSSSPKDSVLSASKKAHGISGEGLNIYGEKSMIEGKLGDDRTPTMFKETKVTMDSQADQPVRISIDRATSDTVLGDSSSLSADHYSLTTDRLGNVSETQPQKTLPGLKENFDDLDRLQARSNPAGMSTEQILQNLGGVQDPGKDNSGTAASVAKVTATGLGKVTGTQALGALGSVAGLAQVWHGLASGDGAATATGLSNVASPLAFLAKSPLFAGSAAADAFNAMGIVGGVITTGIGAYEVATGKSTGDYVKGGLDIGAGTLGILAAATASGPLAIAALVAAAGAFGSDFIRTQVTKSDPHSIDMSLFPSQAVDA